MLLYGKGESKLEKVLGFGGMFFRAEDPSGLMKWYSENLGVDPVPTDYETMPWKQEGGMTVFAPFDKDTDYFGRPEQQFMINFRVSNLDAMIAQLEKAGITVKPDPEVHPNGRFARIHDPEGNPIELWEPA